MRGDRLKEIREARHMTQEDLANRVGITAQQIYRLENGKSNNPKADFLAALAKELEVSIDYLVGIVDDPAGHLQEDDLTPMERRLIWAVRKGLIYEALETVTTISKKTDQTNIATDQPTIDRKSL